MNRHLTAYLAHHLKHGKFALSILNKLIGNRRHLSLQQRFDLFTLGNCKMEE